MKRIVISFLLLCTITSISQTPGKVKDIYDFEVGDIFHWKTIFDDWANPGPNSYNSFVTKFEITKKYYNSSLTTLYYVRSGSRITLAGSAPDLIFTDTVFYPDLDSSLFSIDSIYSDTSLFNGRTINVDDEWGFDQGYDYVYIYGCGREYHYFPQPGTAIYVDLIYYKKGSEEWGTKDYSAIDEARSFSDVSIYPNPSDGIVKFELEHLQGQYLDLKLFDLTGKEVYSIRERVDGTQKQLIQLDLNHLESQLYLLQISNGDHRSSFPIQIK